VAQAVFRGYGNDRVNVYGCSPGYPLMSLLLSIVLTILIQHRDPRLLAPGRRATPVEEPAHIRHGPVTDTAPLGR
jgi:hypothetical protein